MKSFLEVETTAGAVAINPEHIVIVHKAPSTTIHCIRDIKIISTEPYSTVMNRLTRILMKRKQLKP